MNYFCNYKKTISVLLRLSKIVFVSKINIISNSNKNQLMKKYLYTSQFYASVAFICFLIIGNVLIYYTTYSINVDALFNSDKHFLIQSLFFIVSCILFISVVYHLNLKKLKN